MHPRIREVLDYLDHYRSELEKAIEAVPAAARDVRTQEDRWSVAEILEHLGMVEQRVGGVVMGQLEANPDLPQEPDSSSIIPTLDLASLLDRDKPLVARENSIPRRGLSTSAALSLLDESRRSLRSALIAADGKALGTVTVEHPRLGLLNLYQWVLFLAAHEGRHAKQIREIAGAA